MADPEPNGPARELGRGWKCRPYVTVAPGTTAVLAEIEGPGAIQSMWFGGSIMDRDFILRIYWEGQEQPSVECPLTDFFAMPFSFQNPGSPHRRPHHPDQLAPGGREPQPGAQLLLGDALSPAGQDHAGEPSSSTRAGACFYQVNYCLTAVPEQAAYFHAQFRRRNPLGYLEPYVILDGIKGRGHYVGTSMGWTINNSGWWGEGEIKFFIDGDGEYPTICGTGTEDYFGGAYNFDLDGQYTTYTTPFLGMHQVLRPDGAYKSQHRQAMYRWHVMDPINFREDLQVTIQALGWRTEGRLLPRAARHLFGGLLVPDVAGAAVPAAAGAQ